MNDVYNRALFSKKSQEARKTLRDMGGVPSTPPSAGGILASSPELMQAAAMRRPVVMPATQQPMAAPPQPMPQQPMLPPSNPLPNVAGIPSAAPAPRPVAQKPGVKKMANGGDTFLDHYKTPALMKALEKSTGTSFDEAFEFGQKAITTEDPRSLGLPVTQEKMAPVKEALQDSNTAAAGIIEDTVPEDQRTGDLNKDLRTAARAAGITRVPAEAEIDQLNTAIMGAKLGAAIAGSYVDPNTGQELRPTAGARIGQAVAEGLAFRRDTETRRAQQEAELAKAQIAARARTTGKTAKLPSGLQTLVDMFEGRVTGGEDIDKVAAQFNRSYQDNTGSLIMEYVRTNDPSVFGPIGLDSSTATTTEQLEISPEQRLEMVKYALQQQPDNRKAILEQAQKDGVNIEGL